MHRVERDAGFAEFAVALAIGFVLFGLATTVVVVQSINDTRDERRRNPGEGAISLALPFIGPPLPKDPDQAACVRQTASGRGLVWNDTKGWRAPGRYDEPDLTGDLAQARGRISAWTDQMTSYVASVRPDWEPCLAPRATVGAPPPEDKPLVQGRYRLEVGGGGGGCADVPPPGAADVIESGGEKLTISLREAGFPQPLPLAGAIRPDYSFDVELTGEFFGGPVTVRLTGRFDVFEQRTLLRDGVLTYTLSGQSCQFGIFGERLGPL